MSLGGKRIPPSRLSLIIPFLVGETIVVDQVVKGRLGSDEPTALAPPSGVEPASGLQQSRSSPDAALLALAERCAEAVDPDRGLDAEIAVAVLGGEIVWKQANGTMEMYPVRQYASKAHVGGFGNEPVLAYTSSLDAAMALVPEEHAVSFETAVGATLIYACVWHDVPHYNGDATGEVRASSPALALSGSALRARAAQAIEARSAATAKTGAVEDESAVPQGCARPGAGQ